MTFSKIGLHVLRNGVKPALLKTAPVLCLVDCSPEYVLEVRAANINAWIVVRWVFQGDQNAALREPEKAADAWWAAHKAAIVATRGQRVVYQGMNEISSGISDLYVRYETRRAALLWANVAGLGLGAWSVGEPDYGIWPMFSKVLQGMTNSDAVLLHEYWADAADLDRRWYTARWTDVRVAPMVKGKNIIVTEFGRDRIVSSRGKPGWRLTTNAEAFLVEVARYNDLLGASPNVVGGCLFTGGLLGEWKDFDANQLWPRIAAGQGTPEPVPQPAPAPVPPDSVHVLAEVTRWRIEEAIRLLEHGEPEEARELLLIAVPDAYKVATELRSNREVNDDHAR